MYPPTQPPAQTILTAKSFSRFHTNRWFSICSKVALCALDLLIFTKVPVQLRLYVSTEQRAMSHHFLWGSGQCPSILGLLELRAHLLSVLSDLRMLFLWQHNQTSEATVKCLPFQVCILASEAQDLRVMQRSTPVGKKRTQRKLCAYVTEAS